MSENKLPVDYDVSKRFTALRFPLIFGIILLHATLFYGNKNPAIVYILSLTSGLIPAFCIISMYLFFYNLDSYKVMFKKKVRSLVIPYILWSLLLCFVFRRNIFHDIFMYFPESPKTGLKEVFQFFTIFEKDCYFPAVSHLWFIRNLFIVFLISPVIVFFLKKFPFQYMIFITTIYFIKFPGLTKAMDYVTTKFLFYSSIGAILGFYKINFFIILDKISSIFSFLFFSFLCIFGIIFKITDFACVLVKLICLFSCTWFFSISKYLVMKDKIFYNLQYLSRYSFFVYVLHIDVLTIFFTKSYPLIPKTTSSLNIIIILGIAIIVLVISTIISILVKKFMPPVFNLLNGNRRQKYSQNPDF